MSDSAFGTDDQVCRVDVHFRRIQTPHADVGWPGSSRMCVCSTCGSLTVHCGLLLMLMWFPASQSRTGSRISWILSSKISPWPLPVIPTSSSRRCVAMAPGRVQERRGFGVAVRTARCFPGDHQDRQAVNGFGDGIRLQAARLSAPYSSRRLGPRSRNGGPMGSTVTIAWTECRDPGGSKPAGGGTGGMGDQHRRARPFNRSTRRRASSSWPSAVSSQHAAAGRCHQAVQFRRARPAAPRPAECTAFGDCWPRDCAGRCGRKYRAGSRVVRKRRARRPAARDHRVNGRGRAGPAGRRGIPPPHAWTAQPGACRDPQPVGGLSAAAMDENQRQRGGAVAGASHWTQAGPSCQGCDSDPARLPGGRTRRSAPCALCVQVRWCGGAVRGARVSCARTATWPSCVHPVA